jgi:hypothetical protein
MPKYVARTYGPKPAWCRVQRARDRSYTRACGDDLGSRGGRSEQPVPERSRPIATKFIASCLVEQRGQQHFDPQRRCSQRAGIRFGSSTQSSRPGQCFPTVPSYQPRGRSQHCVLSRRRKQASPRSPVNPGLTAVRKEYLKARYRRTPQSKLSNGAGHTQSTIAEP